MPKLDDAIKAALFKYLGQPLTPEVLRKVRLDVLDTVKANQFAITDIQLELVQQQSQIYLTLNIMVDKIQEQIDSLNSQVAALQASLNSINTKLNGLKIGTDIQAYSGILQAIAGLSLANNQVLGTGSTGQISQFDQQGRVIGSIILIPYDPTTTGWTVSGAIYTAPDGWLWYFPNGTALSNINAKYLQLYTALWGTAAYTITGGKGANAQADWAAGKQLLIPDMRGRNIASSGTATPGGTLARAIGSVWGAETATLALTNMAPHNHRVTLAGFTATGLASSGATGLGGITYGNNTIAINQAGTASNTGIMGNRSAAGDGLGAIADAGGSSGNAQPFSITDPSKGYFELWWMGTK